LTENRTTPPFPYRWIIKAVPGKRLRKIGWWLCTAPAGKTIKASGRRYRFGRFLLQITDDRAWTTKHQSSLVLRLRRRFGRFDREYELVEDDRV